VTRWLAAVAWVLASALVLAGCATPQHDAGRPVANGDPWSGRLSVRLESEPAQSFAAGFELHGNARQGRLSLFSPFGATLAQLTWSPSMAQLQADGKAQSFASLDALTQQVVGTELPLAGIFAWLRGEQAEFGDWVPEVQDRSAGRLVARRTLPAPVVEMRLILE